jgi:hypothetical protein
LGCLSGSIKFEIVGTGPVGGELSSKGLNKFETVPLGLNIFPAIMTFLENLDLRSIAFGNFFFMALGRRSNTTG